MQGEHIFQLCRDTCTDAKGTLSSCAATFVRTSSFNINRSALLCVLCSAPSALLPCCPAASPPRCCTAEAAPHQVRHHDAPHREPPPARLLFSKVERSQAIPSLADHVQCRIVDLKPHVPHAHHCLSLDIRLPLDQAGPGDCIDDKSTERFRLRKPSNPQFPNSKTNQHPHPAIGRKPGDAARPLAPVLEAFELLFFPANAGQSRVAPPPMLAVLASFVQRRLAGWLAGGRAAGRALGCDASRHPDPDPSGMNEVSWPCCTLAPGCKLQLIYRRTAGACLVESAERKSGRTLDSQCRRRGGFGGLTEAVQSQRSAGILSCSNRSTTFVDSWTPPLTAVTCPTE
jgi:hypothetical protein